jgi:hypothetical protein
MLNRHLRPPGLILGPQIMPSAKASTTSSTSLPSKIQILPSTSRPDEITSLISEFDEEQFTTPPSQPSPGQIQVILFHKIWF